MNREEIREPRFSIIACMFASFRHGWTRWARWPELVRCDRENTQQRRIRFDSCQERCGDQTCWTGSARTNWKSRTTRCHAQEDDVEIIKDTHASGRESMDMILSECFNAANEMDRHGGFAPAQWVLSRLPRNLATMGDEDQCLDVGALQAHADGPTTFGVQSRYPGIGREAFVRWDCGERVRRAALRKAAPVVGSYQVGDIVSSCREARAGVERWIQTDRFREAQKQLR